MSIISLKATPRIVKLFIFFIFACFILNKVIASAHPPKMSDYKATVALDIGTRYSGYAFQLKNQAPIQASNQWEGEDVSGDRMKTSTSVLLDETGKFRAFGGEAITEYSKDTDNSSLFFKNFKMILYAEETYSDRVFDPNKPQLTAANGKTFPALPVFVEAIRYLENHCLDAIEEETGVKLETEVIQWVVTTPAIWNTAAKFYMRLAARMAGLYKLGEVHPNHLIIALEPEVAALYCRTLPIGQFCSNGDTAAAADKKANEFEKMPHGSKYVVIDAGGGTLDMTAQEVVDDDTVKELVKASGGAHGGSEIDRMFSSFLGDVFSSEFITAFSIEHPNSFQEMMQEFERKKQRQKIKEKGFQFILPHDFREEYKKLSGQDVEDAVKKFKEQGNDVELPRQLFVGPKIVSKFCGPVIERIKDAVTEFITQPEVQGASVFFLVGGFAPFLTSHLRPAIKALFPHAKVLVPKDAGVAVLKGAVMFAKDTDVVTGRVPRETYGISELQLSDEDDSRETQDVKDPSDDKNYRDVFVPLVRKGKRVETPFVSRYARSGRQGALTDIYVCTAELAEDEVAYMADKDKFVRIGRLHLATQLLPSGNAPRIMVKFIVGGTELRVSLTNLVTGETTHTEVFFDSEQTT